MPKKNNLPLLRDKVETRLQEIVSQTHGSFGLCVIDLGDDRRSSIHGGHSFSQASTIKIPVLMEVKLAQSRKLNLSETSASTPSIKLAVECWLNWAIVYAKNHPYIITIMENYGLGQEASGAIKEISKTLYERFSRVSQSSIHGVWLSENLH